MVKTSRPAKFLRTAQQTRRRVVTQSIDFRDKCASKPVPAHDGKPCISWYRKVAGQTSSVLGYPCNLSVPFCVSRCARASKIEKLFWGGMPPDPSTRLRATPISTVTHHTGVS